VHMSWTLSNAAGGIRLQVAPEEEAAARAVLSQQFATDSDEDFVQPVCPKCGAMDVIANDYDRTALPGSIPNMAPLPDRAASEAEWRCMVCDSTWMDDEEPAEQDGTLR